MITFIEPVEPIEAVEGKVIIEVDFDTAEILTRIIGNVAYKDVKSNSGLRELWAELGGYFGDWPSAKSKFKSVVDDGIVFINRI